MRCTLLHVLVACELLLGEGIIAATLTVTNFDGAQSNLLADAHGSLMTSGSVRVGSFGMGDTEVRGAFEQQAPQTVMAMFSQFSQLVFVSFDGLPGLYQSSLQEAIDNDHALLGQSVYTIITETPSLEAAAQWLIYRHNQVFLEDPLPIAPALLNESEGGELLLGTFDKTRASVGQIRDQATFGLILVSVIPEPSTITFMLLSITLVVVPRGRRRTLPFISFS